MRDMNGVRIEVGDRVVAWAWDALPGRIQAIKRGRKQVRKGEHGKTILFPVGPEKEDGKVEAQRFYAATVFDISQVEGRDVAI